MAADPSEAAEVEKLYQYGERLGEAKDKAQVVGDFEGIIKAVKGQSTKAKQLAAQLIPRFMKFFPALGNGAMDSMFDLLEEEDLAVRVHAIRGLSLLCKDRSDYVSKIVDVLVQLLTCEENVERDAVHKALMSLLRQDVKAALTALFKQVENNDESIHEKVIWFLKDKVFPLKAELLKPQVEMERHATDLVKSLQDVTGAEFKLFIDFLKTFSIFGEKAPPEQVQELIQIIEGQADLNAQFNVSDVDHIDRLMACMQMALPFFTRGASSSKFLHYLNAQVIPAFEKKTLWPVKDPLIHYVRYQGKAFLASRGTHLLMKKWRYYFVNFWQYYFHFWSQPYRMHINSLLNHSFYFMGYLLGVLINPYAVKNQMLENSFLIDTVIKKFDTFSVLGLN